MEKNIIIHIGLPKAASSFFQLKIFPFLDEEKVICLGNGNPITNSTPLRYFMFFNFSFLQSEYKKKKAINPLLSYWAKDFEFQTESLEEAKSKINNYINNLKQQHFLLSSEGLCGYIGMQEGSFEANIQQIKYVFPQAKIFITIRRQDKWIESLYNQIVLKEQRMPLAFNKFAKYSNNNKFLQIQELDWLKIYNRCVELYEKENVLVLPMEFLQDSPQEFLNAFYAFTNIPVFNPPNFDKENESIKETVFFYYPLVELYENLINSIPFERIKLSIKHRFQLIPKILKLYKSSLDTKNVKFSSSESEQIKKAFKNSNQELSQLIGIDLQQYKYY